MLHRLPGIGRAMELGRECLELWGYRRCDELVWIKVNQLQKMNRTGGYVDGWMDGYGWMDGWVIK